jgi:hypothetical protein
MDPDVIPSPGNLLETNRNQSNLSGGWILQDPIESGIGLMDMGCRIIMDTFENSSLNDCKNSENT